MLSLLYIYTGSLSFNPTNRRSYELIAIASVHVSQCPLYSRQTNFFAGCI